MEPENTESNEIDKQPSIIPKTKHKKWPWVVGIFAIIILIPVCVLGYFGFVPGVSNVMGANKSKDLGVRYTAQDFAVYQNITGATFLNFANAPANPNKPGKKIVFANPKPVDVILTDTQITAAINSTGWSWMPITNTQVKFIEGGLEVSGNLQLTHIKEFVGFVGGVGYSNADIDTGVAWAGKFINNAPVYIKANASIENDVVNLQITNATIGRFNVPVDQSQKVLQTGTTNVVNNTPNLQVTSATFSDGAVHFVGTIPTTVYVKTN